ncbi:hypothetical protein [Pyrobaculum ferrireducens]|nr:hypothetical protein [Pyrobaculum ferrireducens]
MARKRNYKPLVVLAALAAVALVAAAVTFTNITYWVVNATRPPAMKYPGVDTTVAGGRYAKVSYYFDSANGYNITKISVIGFTGDPVNYTDVIRVCNYYGTTSVVATMYYRGIVDNPNSLARYVKAFYVYWTDPYAQPGTGFITTTNYPQSASVTIDPGQCATAGVYIRIDPDLPADYADGKTILATYQVDIQMTIQ